MKNIFKNEMDPVFWVLFFSEALGPIPNWILFRFPLKFIGAPCDLDRNYWGEFECHYSCPLCNPAHSCDWSSCYDDLGFLEFLIDFIGQEYCLDLNHIHLSGISNGGMLAYFVMATATDGIGRYMKIKNFFKNF